MDDTSKFIITIVLGGVSGATVSIIYNRLIEREKRALEFVKDYFTMREKIGRAKGYLSDADYLHKNPIEAMPIITEVGDKLNWMAYYYKKNILKRDFLDESGIIVDLLDFLNLVDKAQTVDSIKQYFNKAGSSWSHLFDLRAFHLNNRKE